MATVRTMSTAAKLVIKRTFFPLPGKISTDRLIQPQILTAVPARWITFVGSPPMNERPIQTRVEEITDPKVWETVERLITPLVVPVPNPKAEYPSGWKPPSLQGPTKYFVERSRNHMLPVYWKQNRRTLVSITRIRRIHGDIWTFEKELKQYLQKRENKLIDTCVKEAFGILYIRGDHENNVKDFLEQNGF